jgi:hypothetical protein
LSSRANALADRLEQGARALAAFARTLSEAEWNSRIPGDGRKVGVVVHHVAYMYPIEIEVAQILAEGKPVVGLTWDTIHEINAGHAQEHDGVTLEAALDLLRRNSAAAAAAIRELDDAALDRAAPVSLNADALPVLPGGSRGAAQLPPPREDHGRRRGEAVGGLSAGCACHPERSEGGHARRWSPSLRSG